MIRNCIAKICNFDPHGIVKLEHFNGVSRPKLISDDGMDRDMKKWIDD